jgi:hypothetical protein
MRGHLLKIFSLAHGNGVRTYDVILASPQSCCMQVPGQIPLSCAIAGNTKNYWLVYRTQIYASASLQMGSSNRLAERTNFLFN